MMHPSGAVRWRMLPTRARGSPILFMPIPPHSAKRSCVACITHTAAHPPVGLETNHAHPNPHVTTQCRVAIENHNYLAIEVGTIKFNAFYYSLTVASLQSEPGKLDARSSAEVCVRADADGRVWPFSGVPPFAFLCRGDQVWRRAAPWSSV